MQKFAALIVAAAMISLSTQVAEARSKDVEKQTLSGAILSNASEALGFGQTQLRIDFVTLPVADQLASPQTVANTTVQRGTSTRVKGATTAGAVVLTTAETDSGFLVESTSTRQLSNVWYSHFVANFGDFLFIGVYGPAEVTPTANGIEYNTTRSVLFGSGAFVGY
ncbi:MAG: hypothetical protein SFX19_01765 [Alphaproteobacteria bacterium]|nr:hypothetical protein [Alphaproteobacteria bacterium]